MLGLIRVTKLVQLALHALQLLWRIPSRHMATITAKFLQKSSLRQLHVPTSGCTHRMPAVLRDAATATGTAQNHRDVRSDLRHNTFETVRAT